MVRTDSTMRGTPASKAASAVAKMEPSCQMCTTEGTDARITSVSLEVPSTICFGRKRR
ncbi:hypothetical protein D3C86_1361860 [compost metagenome]